MFCDLYGEKSKTSFVHWVGGKDELPARLKPSFFAVETRISCGPKTDLPRRDFWEDEEEDNKPQLENILYLLF